VAALLLMCDPRDLGIAFTEDIADGVNVFEPNLYLYDVYPGGIGQSAPLFKLASRLLSQAAMLIANCPCEHGCPSCVGALGEVGERGKEAAGRFLGALIG
jgi:DEAD/DEAH box helicase domain-containing protein